MALVTDKDVLGPRSRDWDDGQFAHGWTLSDGQDTSGSGTRVARPSDGARSVRPVVAPVAGTRVRSEEHGQHRECDECGECDIHTHGRYFASGGFAATVAGKTTAIDFLPDG